MVEILLEIFSNFLIFCCVLLKFMRLWSLHPSFLDMKGLIAVWREGLLAQKVLLGKTRGYVNHPQLIRFKQTEDPILYIGTYLYYVFLEAKKRGYNFDKSKILKYNASIEKVKVNKGQLEYEYKHLLRKLFKRDRIKYLEIKKRKPNPNPIFRVVNGGIEPWEKLKIKSKRIMNKAVFSEL